MSRAAHIVPSILSADFLNVERDVRLITDANPQPEWLHVDVMDGHFVPNLSIGVLSVQALKKTFDVKLDVHLMIDNPAVQLNWYLDAGADLVTIAAESHAAALNNATAIGSTHRVRHKGTSYATTALGPAQVGDFIFMLERIRKAGALAGISINPDTPAVVLKPLMGHFDLVLVMSVHPGFAAQSFIPSCIEKIQHIVEARTRAIAQHGERADFLIEIDGGINLETARIAVEAGADLLVAGNAIFGAPDPREAFMQLKRVCDDAKATEKQSK